MDTITHALIGYSLYKSVKVDPLTPNNSRALLATSLLASQAPDFDVIVNLTETGRIMNQMWHRGITHSIFLIPFIAVALTFVIQFIFKTKDRRIFYLMVTGLFIHSTLDLFNPWGTGYLEPFSSIRISIGTIPIMDFLILFILLGAIIASKIRPKNTNRQHQVALALITIYICTSTFFALYKEHPLSEAYSQTTIVASYIPFSYNILGKKDGEVDVYKTYLFKSSQRIQTYASDDNINLEPLFKSNPKAKVLQEWAPFVVVVNSNQKLGIFDPRIMNGNEPLNYEYIRKQ